jgi:alpha-L-fucosidase
MRAALATLAALVLTSATTGAQEPQPLDPYAEETPAQRDARMSWWREAKFGMFIHWGVYAVPAGTYAGERIDGIGEWIMNRGRIPVAEYRALAPGFTASEYRPQEWVALAKRAGMRYIVITSKHHDGFALFDSGVTEWDAVDASGARRDLIAPLAAAAREQGLRFGLYYSQAQDWTHPGGAKAGYAEGESWDEANKGDFDEYLRTIAEPQVAEILTRFQPDILWWDTPVWMTRERADRLVGYLREVPGIIHNNRLGGGYRGDTETPEQHIPATGFEGRDWEVCMTMNDTWGFKSYDRNWKSVEDLVRKLCDIVSKGGNFLLNVGPTAEGVIPVASVERLEAVGRWMDVNGEAIYGTTASPFHRLPWGRCTKRLREGGATLYLHVFDWPADGELLVPGLGNEVRGATLLAGGAPIEAARNEEGVVLSLPAEAPDPIASVLKLEVSGALDIEPVTLRQRADGRIVLDVLYAELSNPGYGAHAQVEEKGGELNIGYWTDARARVQWTFQVAEPGTFVVSTEVAGPAQSAFDWGLDDELQRFTFEPSGGYDSFRRVELGRVTIDAPGRHRLALRPVADGWSAINLRAVTLTPR